MIRQRHRARVKRFVLTNLASTSTKATDELQSDLTSPPFIERPSIEVTVKNILGAPAGSLTVVETLDTNFSLTLHLRDREPTDVYEVSATLYYATPETGRTNVHTVSGEIDVSTAGEQFTLTD